MLLYRQPRLLPPSVLRRFVALPRPRRRVGSRSRRRKIVVTGAVAASGVAVTTGDAVAAVVVDSGAAVAGRVAVADVPVDRVAVAAALRAGANRR